VGDKSEYCEVPGITMFGFKFTPLFATRAAGSVWFSGRFDALFFAFNNFIGFAQHEVPEDTLIIL